MNLSGELKGAGGSCVLGEIVLNLRMNLITIRISALLSLVINVKARDVWSAEVSLEELHMFLVHGNGAKAHETRVKWAVRWCQGSMAAVGDRFSPHTCQ